MEDGKKIKVSFFNFNLRLEDYLKNLLKLLDQEEFWFCKRIEAIQEGDYEKVDKIERLYLNPLNLKIQRLVERMSK